MAHGQRIKVSERPQNLDGMPHGRKKCECRLQALTPSEKHVDRDVGVSIYALDPIPCCHFHKIRFIQLICSTSHQYGGMLPDSVMVTLTCFMSSVGKILDVAM